MNAANPYLYFDGDAEEAFGFYRSVFGGEFTTVMRFGDFPDNPMGIPESDFDKIAHIALPLGPANTLMGTDHLESFPEAFSRGNDSSITLEPETPEEAERLFEALSAGGRVGIPLERADWAEKHGTCVDRYGVRWMVNYVGDASVDPEDGVGF